MTSETVTKSIQDKAIGIITLNKPAVHNAFDEAVIHELTAVITELEQQASVRVILLQAAGKFFSAGADLNWMKASAALDYNGNLKQAEQLALLMRTLNDCTKPTIAKVQGSAFGGAVGLISCCDIAISSEQAAFVLSEVKLGLVPAVISPYVIAAIGERMARRYFITAEKFTAQDALKMGLLHEVVSSEVLDEYCDSVIQTLLQNGPQAIVSAKRLIKQISGAAINDATVQLTTRLIAEVRTSEEAKNGMSAFFQKTKPNWNA